MCDSALRLPLSSKLVQTARQTPLMIATACTDEARRAPYMAEGCQLINVPRDDGGLKLDVLMRALGERKIDSILLEGGSTLAWSAPKGRSCCAARAGVYRSENSGRLSGAGGRWAARGQKARMRLLSLSLDIRSRWAAIF